MLSQVFSQLFLAEGESKISAIGIAGAGLATCIANDISLAFCLLMYYRKRKSTVVCFHPQYCHARGGICSGILSVGIPTGLVLLANLRGIDGIVISQPLTENFTAIVLFAIYCFVMKREKSRIPEHEEPPERRKTT